MPTSGTFSSNNQTGLRVRFILSGNGSTSTTNSWITGVTPVNTISGITLPASVANLTFAITGLQLEYGSTATDFERRPYAVELAMVRRYHPTYSGIYNSSGTATNTPAIIGSGITTASTTGSGVVVFTVPTRVPVSGIFNNGIYPVNIVTSTGTINVALNFSSAGISGALVTFNASGAGYPEGCYFTTVSGYYVAFTGAEL
jgi:hypothetical protein